MHQPWCYRQHVAARHGTSYNKNAYPPSSENLRSFAYHCIYSWVDGKQVSTVGGDKLLLSLEYSLLALFLLDPFIKKEFPRTLHGSGHFSRARSGQGGPTRSDPTREISNIS